MSNSDTDSKDYKENNKELGKKLQYWKMVAAQRENQNLDLMKQNNDLRLKLSRLQNGGATHARNLEAEITSTCKLGLSHLVQASNLITTMLQLTKAYVQKREELETTLPRWSSISNTTSNGKVHRVMPMLIGGQSIQPVVSLSRTPVNMNNLRTNGSSNNNQNHNFSERGPLPMHMLQDLYIPLTRIDVNGLPVNSMDVDPDTEESVVNNSAEDLHVDDDGEQSHHESQNLSDSEQYDDTPMLEAVEEALEPEDEVQPSPKPRADNPLEGPSWMLDGPSKGRKTKSRKALEPDSTTQCDEPQGSSPAGPSGVHPANTECDRVPPAEPVGYVFSPTERRRKRTTSPPAALCTPRTPRTSPSFSPQTAARRITNNGRILKVLVSKLRLEIDDVTPPKRPSLNNSPMSRGSVENSVTKKHASDNSPARSQSGDKSPSIRTSRDMQLLTFDAPSPNGATTSHVVISESTSPVEAGGSGEPGVVARRISKHDRYSRDSKHDSRNSRDTKHDSRNSRDTKHDSNNGRESKHDKSKGRETKHDNSAGQDSDSSISDMANEGRTRRTRKAVTYKEKPLNRKMRR